MTDLASAARRVADDTRQGNRPLPDDMDTLLSVLDAVAAGRDDAGRVERWARAIAVAVGKLENRWEWFVAEARAAIALADAERAVVDSGAWRTYESARDDLEDAVEASRRSDITADSLATFRAAIDAAVRRLAGLSDPA